MSAQQVTLDEEGANCAVKCCFWRATLENTWSRYCRRPSFWHLNALFLLLDAAAGLLSRCPATRMRLSVPDAACGAKIIDDS